VSEQLSEQAVREAVVALVEADPERYLSEYERTFGNVLNADNAATLFDVYNENPAKYRVAVHPAAQWIRDELFRRALACAAEKGRDRVVFTAGGNAAGKSTAVSFSRAAEHSVAVLDSTFGNYEHAHRLIEQATKAHRKITILYVNRPLDDALLAMLDRAHGEGRVVTLSQLINSQRGAAETVRRLWGEHGASPDFAFCFFDNSPDKFKAGVVDLAVPEAYNESRKTLGDILDTEYAAGRISEATYGRVKGGGEPAVRG
jgi:hypothetical protein